MSARQSGDDNLAILKELQSCSNCNGKGIIPTIETTLRQDGMRSFWEEAKTDRTCWVCGGRGYNPNVVVR